VVLLGGGVNGRLVAIKLLDELSSVLKNQKRVLAVFRQPGG